MQLLQRHGRLIPAEDVHQLQRLDERLDLPFFRLFHGGLLPVFNGRFRLPRGAQARMTGIVFIVL